MEQQKPTGETQVPPTKEQIIEILSEQIEVKSLQLKVQKLNARLAMYRVQELQALTQIANITNPSTSGGEYEGGQPHTLTEDDIKNNPELTEAGLKAGDEVLIPSPPKQRNLKK